MYFRVNLKMKKPTLCRCFTWIVFIELNFTVTFLLITWNDGFDELGKTHKSCGGKEEEMILKQMGKRNGLF